MTEAYYQDLHTTVYNQDFRENELLDESVQMVVTSPPYWGLRRYSGEQELVWGEPSSDEPCRHQWELNERKVEIHHGEGKSTLSGAGTPAMSQWVEGAGGKSITGFCSLCGAWKGAYGLEPTPEMYVQHTIEILREIRRVLRRDGCVLWNCGDTYWGGKGSSARHDHNLEQRKAEGRTFQKREYTYDQEVPQDGKHSTLKPKDLCLIPFRVAIAAQEDGWWVRSVIIWSKPNPMPESVTDRPTESHEYILMLTKSARYYWDADAVREPHTRDWSQESWTQQVNYGNKMSSMGQQHTGKAISETYNPSGRNIRTVWEFPTQPYPKAHFAVFPEKLPEICIKAATPEVGCCSKCGAPWERILDNQKNYHSPRSDTGKPRQKAMTNVKGKIQSESGGAYYYKERYNKETSSLGWKPTCKCSNADKVPSVVLDPFAGAGTTLWLAKTLNRKAIGFEISEEYCQFTEDRLRQQVML